MYKQLTSEQRYVISALLKRETSPKEIAEEIGCHISTVYREKSRNACKDGHYSPKIAHEMAMERRERIVTNSKLKPGVMDRALSLLKEEQWSPRQISGALALQGVKISHERIYQEIRKDASGELASHTRHNMKHRKKYGNQNAGVKNIPNRTSIHERPAEADGKRLGDWEMDLIVDNYGHAILTMVERSQSFLQMHKLPLGKKSESLAREAARLLFPWRKYVLTITTDNGGEFAAHELLAKLLHRKSLPDIKVYFADPYASWQKGAIENINGLIRQYIPKGANFDDFSDDDILKIQHKLNRRPREKLNFLSPIQAMNRKIS